ncbi:bifunctional 3-(3-hydroxy-phenyl)propionate/3-hydroxycinnamic acid hydroxylase [Antrihabitans sp. YC3-6]|uniref:Bifunctional 3-(3-hydroxy-phenyl)propionate/3-hydroxycinnamic acid hydroxylase n=1 Tax=Antrihabitans stalagmiti TaxID=2799499 RepID=A0A934NQG2_9NOCA|nr:bifunctional 3-(3-hydroxy-phenyl)propionate/3-hydroxycinnamic acid hydroxylase [Antrihabitans stalagmiti]MBJ8339458.1 bifunctional 3-(3-hydroxy-phenyl)propionate/3-hydroxycinnamic acid hydroxylase [Antrihabitans stalagmiti]
MKTYDVVVIGFGPVGQMVCAQLGQAGHSVAAFESHATLYGLSRAGHMDDEIVRTLQKIGVDEEFKTDAVPWDMYDMRTKAFGGDLLLRLDWSQIGPHGHRGHWIFYQNYLELAMNGAVSATGNVDVTMATRAVDFEQDDEGVTVTLENRQSRERTQVRAKYLIAADGANSSVREQLGIQTWVGNCDYEQLVVDTKEKHKLNFEFDNGQFADPARPGCLFQLGATHHRWEWTLLPGETPEDFTEERVWELLSPWVGPDDVEILRRPVYRFREVVAEHWQDGRVFLAGDAAHVLWPFAGEGMCNGIRDASALAWRLNLVLRGQASSQILDSYTADRKPNFVAWMHLSREIGLPCVITDPGIAAMRDQGMKAALTDPSLIPPMPEIPGPTAFARPDDPTAGAIAHQGNVAVDGKTGLFDDLVGTGWVLLTTDPDAFAALTDQQRDLINRIGIVTAHVGAPGSGAPIADVDGTYAAWLGSLGRSTVLIRPDFWLFGSVSNAADAGDLLDSFAAGLAGRFPTPARVPQPDEFAEV